MTVAVLPASFDPITCGHVDIATRASRVFPRLVVAVYAMPKKNVLFSLDERLTMVRESLAGLPHIDVMPFDGLFVDFARRIGASVEVRGLRAVSDFEYEYQHAAANRQMLPGLEVVSLFPSTQYAFLSSSIVKEIAENGGDVSSMVPEPVARRLRERFGSVQPAVGG
ncbi:MAG TPA: pantetheine-phosphate adenylyltransferase [Chloroflexota bacterium]|nr:pantetheine-phosphate adenylyltransferase [Chloroflexota bacterium]